jgi:hypothetical protein
VAQWRKRIAMAAHSGGAKVARDVGQSMEEAERLPSNPHLPSLHDCLATRPGGAAW